MANARKEERFSRKRNPPVLKTYTVEIDGQSIKVKAYAMSSRKTKPWTRKGY